MAIPSVTAPRYVLLRAADVMDTPSKAPYVWVEEANVPVALICRNPDVIAPVSVAIKYLPAPRGGTISPWQGGAAICHVRIGPD